MVRIIQITVSSCLLASCAVAEIKQERVFGKIDENYYQRYANENLSDNDRKTCESRFILESDIISLIKEYDQVDSNFAYQTLEVTPCRFEGTINFQGAVMRFRWYPSGYLVIYAVGNELREPSYFVCRGHSDDDGAYVCDREHELSRLR